jgi:Tat protein secretion system quality control protein TatD with DNase activity
MTLKQFIYTTWNVKRSMLIKSRNEPCVMVQIIEVVAELLGMKQDVLAK